MKGADAYVQQVISESKAIARASPARAAYIQAIENGKKREKADSHQRKGQLFSDETARIGRDVVKRSFHKTRIALETLRMVVFSRKPSCPLGGFSRGSLTTPVPLLVTPSWLWMYMVVLPVGVGAQKPRGLGSFSIGFGEA